MAAIISARRRSAILAEQTGLPNDVVELAARRCAYGVQPITSQVINEQQKIADAFAKLKLIPKPIKVQDALLAKL